jgi:hypothetical protein
LFIKLIWGFCDVKSTVLKTQNELERQAGANYADLKFQAAENKSAIILDSTQNANAISKQLAECCCEIKEKISMRADQTDFLINSIEKERIRDQLRAAQNDNLINSIVGRLGGTLPLSTSTGRTC